MRSMDHNTPHPPSRPRSTLATWVNPDEHSPWTALWVTTVVWSLLGLVWLLYLILADVETYRMFLYPVLFLVALVQVGAAVVAMRKKRALEARGPGRSQDHGRDQGRDGGRPDWYGGPRP